MNTWGLTYLSNIGFYECKVITINVLPIYDGNYKQLLKQMQISKKYSDFQ